jgi:signal recognition particle receptor subunit beta
MFAPFRRRGPGERGACRKGVVCDGSVQLFDARAHGEGRLLRPGICGKTTNLQFIHENLPGEVRGKMLALATKTDRTLFFDFLPIDLGEIRGMKTRVQLYTVPGQVFYNETRKLVLKGVDGIVFVADSQETMLGANVESFKNLEENLKAHGMKLSEIPHVIQFNKRDLPKLSAIEDMNAALNKYNAPFYESVGHDGIGVQDTLKAIVKLGAAESDQEVRAQIGRGADGSRRHARSRYRLHGRDDVRPRIDADLRASRRDADHAAGGAHELRAFDVQPAAAAQRGSAPASPGTRKGATPPVETMPPFREDEIDGLVDEVEDFAPTPPAADDSGGGVHVDGERRRRRVHRLERSDRGLAREHSVGRRRRRSRIVET